MEEPMKKRLYLYLTILALALLSAGSAFAQATASGTILGTVIDQSQGVVPGGRRRGHPLRRRATPRQFLFLRGRKAFRHAPDESVGVVRSRQRPRPLRGS